jgi:hypothetical protein
MGVGGGVLVVPALTLWLGFAQQAAQGTSLAIILVTAPAGAYEHWRRGNVRMTLVPGLAIGAAVGAAIAAEVAQGLPRILLTRMFAVFLVATAIMSWLRASRRAPAAGAAPARG